MRDPAGLVRRVTEELDAHAITWCHWKSNDMLAASASGENDLDLLVARADVTRCRAVLHDLGFVEAVQRPSRRLPGVLDYHGNDPELGRPLHVHLHSRLVLGDDMTKNYHLPIEDAYLASIRRDGLFWVPAPEMELLVFLVRMVLKHCAPDAVLMLQGRLSAGERRELQHLERAATWTGTAGLADELVPEVGSALLRQCRAAAAGDLGLVRRLQVGRALERALASHARRPVGIDVPLKALRRVYWLARRVVAPRSRRKSLAHGGLVVAISGARDTSARRHLVEEVDRWLSRDVAVLPVEYGADPARAARRAGRFAAAGGIVLAADHPSAGDTRTSQVPPPDVTIVIGGGSQAHAGQATVHVDASTDDLVQAVRHAIWDWL